MRKNFMLIISMLLIFTVLLAGCGQKKDESVSESKVEVDIEQEPAQEEVQNMEQEEAEPEAVIKEGPEEFDALFDDDEPIGDFDDMPKGLPVSEMQEYTLGGDIMPLEDISLVIDQLNVLFPAEWFYEGNTARRGYEYFATTGEFDYYLYPMVKEQEIVKSEIDYTYEENGQYILQAEFDTLGEGVDYEPAVTMRIYNKSTGTMLLFDIKCQKSDGCFEYPSYGVFKEYLDANVELVKSQLGM